jgi:hypothetical protein
MSASGKFRGPYVVPFDPNDLANRFSNFPPEEPEEELCEEDLISVEEMQELIEASSEYESQIVPLLERLPERESDLIDLYFLKRKKQAEIAIIFGVTQAAISYRLVRGIQRIKFLLSIPQVSEEDLRRDLATVFPQQLDVDILVGMWQTTCQSTVATALNRTQGQVRHRFFKAVKVLEEVAKTNETMEPYRKIFSTVANKGFCTLHEVKLPQWSGRGQDSVD